MEREFQDSIGLITDVYSNDGFERYVNDEKVIIPDSMANRYQESVNSVHYFSILPFGLKDNAVNSKYLGEVSIKDREYYKIEISFDQEGGGQDFEDIFIYWINKESDYIDYLAYKFHVNGGGMRFREAFNERFINGVRIVDYRNYKPAKESEKLNDLGNLYANGNLELLSKIELENFQITY